MRTTLPSVDKNLIQASTSRGYADSIRWTGRTCKNILTLDRIPSHVWTIYAPAIHWFRRYSTTTTSFKLSFEMTTQVEHGTQRVHSRWLVLQFGTGSCFVYGGIIAGRSSYLSAKCCCRCRTQFPSKDYRETPSGCSKTRSSTRSQSPFSRRCRHLGRATAWTETPTTAYVPEKQTNQNVRDFCDLAIFFLVRSVLSIYFTRDLCYNLNFSRGRENAEDGSRKHQKKFCFLQYREIGKGTRVENTPRALL